MLIINDASPLISAVKEKVFKLNKITAFGSL